MVTLECSKPFRNLTPAELSSLRRIAQELPFSKGQEIFKEGAPGDGVYVLKQGRVEILTRAASGEQHVFASIAPGELFGEMAVLELKPRSATAIACEDSVAHFIPREELLNLIGQSPMLAMELLREISQRLREFNQRYVHDVIQAERLAVVGRFARSIVHDIKNPLNIISLTAEMSCMDRITPEARQKAAVTIRKQVERVSEMVGDILDFTQGPQSSVVLAEIDYAQFLRQTVDELRPEAELRRAVLEVSEFVPVRVACDPRRLRRVFHNLVHNATDAMPDGGTIWLRAASDGNEVVTEIEDSGPGIAPEIAGRLFQAFATHGKAHGTGLGLSICKKIVEDHGGRIWTRSEPGKGAIFCIALPIARAAGT